MKIIFYKDETVLDHNRDVESEFKAGVEVELNEASANYWIGTGKAVEVDNKIVSTEEAPKKKAAKKKKAETKADK